jgi:hypothetical protein
LKTKKHDKIQTDDVLSAADGIFHFFVLPATSESDGTETGPQPGADEFGA